MSRCSEMLIYLRKRAGLSQVELSDKINLSRSAISMYETAKREPNLETLEIFADFYNVDMNTLTGCEESSALSDADLDNELVALLSELLPEEIPLVVAYAQGIIAARNKGNDNK